MISQVFPVAIEGGVTPHLPVARHRAMSANPFGEMGYFTGHGSLRLQFHLASRRKGARLDPGILSFGARARRLRWALLLPGTGPAGGGRRRQRAARRNRSADHALSALFGRARRVHAFALRHERDAEDRRRGESDPLRCGEESCRHHRGDFVCRSWPQIPDLGARMLPRAARGGHRDGARVEEATGLPGGGARSAKSTGMMMGSGSISAAGGPARHIPVLGRQVVEYLVPRDGGIYIDGTFGAGGHTRAILEIPGTRLIGIDRDRNAVADGFGLIEQSGGRLTLVEDQFSHLEDVARGLGHEAVDGILLDLGVSSMQLDEPERGFSFRND